ncbi:MAG: hypothetical protein PVJ21_01875 [Anaerolineales bacterium]|jgi:hypothetical protein
MKQINLSHKNTSDTGWQLLGELDLSVRPEDEFTINTWLTDLLKPLDLSTDFMNRVVTSVQDSVSRIMQPSGTISLGHIHLSFYAPNERIRERNTWGFFHIERIENRADSVNTNDHAINFYLYVEGQ